MTQKSQFDALNDVKDWLLSIPEDLDPEAKELALELDSLPMGKSYFGVSTKANPVRKLGNILLSITKRLGKNRYKLKLNIVDDLISQYENAERKLNKYKAHAPKLYAEYIEKALEMGNVLGMYQIAFMEMRYGRMTTGLMKDYQGLDRKLFKELNGSLGSAVGYRRTIMRAYSYSKMEDYTDEDLFGYGLEPRAIVDLFEGWTHAILRILRGIRDELQLILGTYPEDKIKELQDYYREAIHGKSYKGRTEFGEKHPLFNPNKDSAEDIAEQYPKNLQRAIHSVFDKIQEAESWVEKYTGVKVSGIQYTIDPSFPTALWDFDRIVLGTLLLDDTGIIVHELGHEVESKYPKARKAADVYYEAKALREDPVLTTSITGIDFRKITKDRSFMDYIYSVYPRHILNSKDHLLEYVRGIATGDIDYDLGDIENSEFISVALQKFFSKGSSWVKRNDLTLWIVMTALFPKLESA